MSKIVMMSDYYNAGGVSYVMDALSRGFAKNHEVELVFFEKTPLAYETSLPISFLNERKYKLRFLAKFINKFAYPYKLYKVLKKINPDVILCFKTKPNIAAILANFFLKKPLVIGEHDVHYGTTTTSRRLSRRLFYPFSSFLTVLNEGDFKHYDFIKNKMIMPNPLNLAKFKGKNEEYKKENIILSVARLENQKNIDFLLRSLALIKTELEGWKVLLAGDGVLRKDLEKLAENLDVKVEFLGHVKEVDTLYKRAKIFVLSSYNEGFGLVLLEAAFFKTTRLAVKSVGSSMLIKDGFDGVRVEYKEEAFAAALKDLLDDESLREKLAKNASKIDLSKYELENVLKLWEEIFAKIGVKP